MAATFAPTLINCGSAAYRRVGTVAVATIAAYSVGCFAGFAVLLARARPDKHPNRQLSLAIRFLHSEYRPEYFFWELMEMLRRFVLVGVFVVVEQGSVEQLAYATLFSIAFSIVQAACAPYRMPSDNAMALGCSLALSVLFVICMIYKYGELTDLDDVQAGMTSEQKINYAPPYVSLSFIALACCVGAFIMLGASTFIQLGVERRRKLFEARAAKARRLRWGDDGTEVFLGALIIPNVSRPTLRRRLRSRRSPHDSTLPEPRVGHGAGPDAHHQAAALGDAARYQGLPRRG